MASRRVPLGSLSPGDCFRLPEGHAIYVTLDQGKSAQSIVKAFQTNLFVRNQHHADVDVEKVINGMDMHEFVWCVSLQGGVLCSFRKNRVVAPGWGGFVFKEGKRDGP